MKIIIKEVDGIRVRYERMVRRVGEGLAKEAFARALTHETEKIQTQVRRAIHKQTSIPLSQVRYGTHVRPATPSVLTAIIEANGRHLSLKEFKPRQFSYGTRAKVWNRSQKFPSAFIVAKNGHVFKRLSSKRLPIEKLWGPSIPVEMLKDQSKAAFEAAAPQVAKRATHELRQLLKV